MQDALDREAIRHQLAVLARGEDRRDAGLISSAFWPDANVHYGVFEGDFAAYLAWVVPGADAITNTQHVLGQSYIEIARGTAKVETQVISYHRMDYSGGGWLGGGENDTVIGGRYLDVFEQRDGEWRIASRIMLYDWYADWGKAIDWSQGLMTLPLPEHFAGRARGDASETFFAERP